MAKLDRSAWIAIVSVGVAVAGAMAALLTGFFQTRVAAGQHEVDFVEHVGHFESHLAHAEARDKVIDEVRDEVVEQRKLQRELLENQIRTMERLKIQPVNADRRRRAPP